jgi:putative ABC transport system ATP-binding protein
LRSYGWNPYQIKVIIKFFESFVMIEIKNLAKNVLLPNKENLCILEEINLTLPNNKTIAIVGQSGSGKSTLLSLIAGLEKPSQGEILFFGEKITSYSEEQLSIFRSKNIGFIFQSFHLLPHFNALTNVSIAAKIAGIENSKEKAREELKNVGLEQRINHFPSSLSGGESQRVAIARALVTQPKFILCDEPTGSLDPQNAQNIFSLLLNANKNKKTGIVIVTHDFNLANECSIVIELHNGKIKNIRENLL